MACVQLRRSCRASPSEQDGPSSIDDELTGGKWADDPRELMSDNHHGPSQLASPRQHVVNISYVTTLSRAPSPSHRARRGVLTEVTRIVGIQPDPLEWILP